MPEVQLSEFVSEVGPIGVAERGGCTLAVTFGGIAALATYEQELARLGPVVQGTGAEGAATVREFLRGQPVDARLDWALVRGEFARRVLLELTQVPAGRTVTYGELAARVGSPGASRAVGGVMSRNPLPFLVPCHRVLPASGRLGHYSGGGPSVKRWLLEREAAVFKP